MSKTNDENSQKFLRKEQVIILKLMSKIILFSMPKVHIPFIVIEDLY